MTPEERAALLYDSLAGADAWNVAGPRSRESALRELAAAIRAAVLAEREACLAACAAVESEWEKLDGWQEGCHAASECVEAIRRRSEPAYEGEFIYDDPSRPA